MSKNSIKINGAKLRSLLESSTGKSLTEISLDNGFSKNFLSEACRVNKASNAVQAVSRLYGISPEAYIIKEPEKTERTQISIDDYESIKKDELKSIIKSAIFETLDDFVCKEISGTYDPLARVYTVNIKIK